MNTQSALSSLFGVRYVWSFGVFEADRLEFCAHAFLRRLLYVPGGKLASGLQYVHTNADPFLFVRDDALYVFYESVSRNGRGVIKAFSTNDLKSFSDLGVVLREDFHLSYPQVLQVGYNVYMIPESSAAGKVFLYRFRNFPYDPEVARVLLHGAYFDSSVLFADGMYYLFATSERGLELFMAKDPARDEFVPHPCSPITADPRYSRCGGRPLAVGGELYRVAQDCSVRYGSHLNLMRIVVLSPTEYREHLAVAPLPFIEEPWQTEGSHHFDWIEYRNRTIVAIDGRATAGIWGKVLSLISRLRAA